MISDEMIILWVLAGVTLLAALVAVLVGLRPVTLLRRLPHTDVAATSVSEADEPAGAADAVAEMAESAEREAELEAGIEADAEYRAGVCNMAEAADIRWPRLSVIVYAFTGADTLPQWLDNLMQQDYPDFEVIVVQDASAEAARSLADTLPQYDNLYITFIPPGSRSLSRRKLALTLGMKAAKGDVVLTTVNNSMIPSARWLRDMCRPFADDPATEIVLGYSTPDYSQMKGPWRAYRRFDGFLTGASWVGAALAGRPYRGDGYNLAMRRSTFFSHKGYAASIYLHGGDDDLFINEIATGDNTAVVISTATILTTCWGVSTRRIWNEMKERYDFNSRWLPRRYFLLAGLRGCMQWLALLSALAVIVLALWPVIAAGGCPLQFGMRLLAAVVALLMLIVLWITEAQISRRGMDVLADGPRARRHAWAAPFFLLWHPLGNALFRLRHRSARYRNFTWERHNNHSRKK